MWNTRRLKEASSGCMLLFLRGVKTQAESVPQRRWVRKQRLVPVGLLFDRASPIMPTASSTEAVNGALLVLPQH